MKKIKLEYFERVIPSSVCIEMSEEEYSKFENGDIPKEMVNPESIAELVRFIKGKQGVKVLRIDVGGKPNKITLGSYEVMK